MSLPRFFLENQVLAAETEAVFPLRLAPDDAKHARVLRLTTGEHIAVIDADPRITSNARSSILRTSCPSFLLRAMKTRARPARR